MKTEQVLLYGGGALAAYMLFLKPKTAVLPGSTVPILTSPGGTAMVGINSGVRMNGGTGAFIASNYAQLLVADPNLGNPNYTMTPAQNSTYLNNYLDIAQAMPIWVGHKLADGSTPNNIAAAAQSHWRLYGCAEKRIYYPMQPPSSAPYIPPPANQTSSNGGSWVSTALGIATTVIGLLGEPAPLNDGDLQALFCMSAVIKDILPLYAESDPLLTRAIEVKLNALLTTHS